MIIRNLSKFLLLILLLFALSEAFSHILCKSEQYPYVRLTEQEKTLLQSLAKGLHADKTTCVQETATLTPAELEDYRLQIRIIEALSPTTEEEAYIKVLMDRTGTSTLDQLQEKLGLKERKNFIRKVLEKIGLIREKPSTAALSQYSLEVNQATIDLLNKLKAPLAQKSFFTELRERVGCAADATLDDLKTKVDSWLESGKEKLETAKEKTVEVKQKAEEKLGTLKERTVQGAETVAEKIKGAGEQGIDALKEKSEALKQKAKETFEDAKEKMNAAAETVKEKKDELQEKAACAGETVKETVMEGAETIKEKAAEGAEAVKETVEKTQHAAADWLKEKAETVKEGFQRAKDKTEQLKEAGAEKVKGIICEENAKSPNCPGYGL